MALYKPLRPEDYGVRPDLIATVEGVTQPGAYAAQTLYGPQNQLGTRTVTEAQPGVSPEVGSYLRAVQQQEAAQGQPTFIGTHPGTFIARSPEEIQQSGGYRYIGDPQRLIGLKGKQFANDYEAARAGGRSRDEAWVEASTNQRELALAAIKASGSGQDAASLTPDAIDYWAKFATQTGTTPPLGMKAGGLRSQILNRAAELGMGTGGGRTMHDIPSAATNKAQFNAQKNALSQLASLGSKVKSFEATANKNADLALKLSGKVDNTGVPIINKWINIGKRETGDPDIAAFNTAITTFANEYAKVISNATGGQVTSDQARKEVQDMINTSQTPQQIMAVIGLAKQEMENRRIAIDEELGTLRGGIEGIGMEGPSTDQGDVSGMSDDELLRQLGAQ